MSLTIERIDEIERLCGYREEWDSVAVEVLSEALPELLRLARRAIVTEQVVEAALKWADSRIDDEDSTQRLVKVLHELKANELKADR